MIRIKNTHKKAIAGTTIIVIAALLIVVIITLGALARVVEIGEGVDFSKEILSFDIGYLVPILFYSPGIILMKYISEFPKSKISVYDTYTEVNVFAESALASNFSQFQKPLTKQHQVPFYLVDKFNGGEFDNSFVFEVAGKKAEISTILAKEKSKTELECDNYINYDSYADFFSKNVLIVYDDSSQKSAENLWKLLGGDNADSKVKLKRVADVKKRLQSEVEESAEGNTDLFIHLRKNAEGNAEKLFIETPTRGSFKIACLIFLEIPSAEISQTDFRAENYANNLQYTSAIYGSEISLVIEAENDYSGRLYGAIRRYYSAEVSQND